MPGDPRVGPGPAVGRHPRQARADDLRDFLQRTARCDLASPGVSWATKWRKATNSIVRLGGCRHPADHRTRVLGSPRDRLPRARSGLPDARHARPVARRPRGRGDAGRMVGGHRPRPAPARHHRRRRRDQGHRGHPAAGRGRRAAGRRPGSPPSSHRRRARRSPGTRSASWPRPRSRACSTPDAAVALAAVRGREMAAACALEPTGMSAVLGGDPDEVLAHARASSGSTRPTATAPARSWPPARSTRWPRSRRTRRTEARVIALPVAGAFHTRFMAPAEDALRGRAARCRRADPIRPLLSNADGAVVTDRRRGAAPPRRAGHPARPLGRLHGHPGASSASPR